MEEWHQKLHNNTSPDDVVICQVISPVLPLSTCLVLLMWWFFSFLVRKVFTWD